MFDEDDLAAIREVDRLYTPADVTDLDHDDLGFPGEAPFTRGVYPTMYRGRPWTMRQFAGYGTAEETNERFNYLVEEGQTGLSTAFDMPSLMGIDSDDPMAEGEVGKEGVAVDTLRDVELLFEDLELAEVSTSFTINPSAVVIYAMYVALADRRGVDRAALRGTPERHAQGVHRPEGVGRRPRAVAVDRHRRDRVRDPRAAG